MPLFNEPVPSIPHSPHCDATEEVLNLPSTSQTACIWSCRRGLASSGNPIRYEPRCWSVQKMIENCSINPSTSQTACIRSCRRGLASSGNPTLYEPGCLFSLKDDRKLLNPRFCTLWCHGGSPESPSTWQCACGCSRRRELASHSLLTQVPIIS